MSKSIHLRPGNSSRKRPRTYESDSGFTKRYKSDYEQYAVSRPLSCNTDQCVPSCNGDESLFPVAHNDGLQLDFFDDYCLSNSIDKKSEEHPLGSFAVLPPEMFHLVLALLENSDLDVLASTSAEMCVAVCGYVYTPVGLNFVLPQYSEGDFAEPLEFNHLGMTL